ncbi:hypothetical protein [Poriferisphaera sp. WC338]|uniref:hypothetical protein n=1 Tax=Poriferisphaera sp. WC338 TaxID=3425129 RepID=UPI003D81731C
MDELKRSGKRSGLFGVRVGFYRPMLSVAAGLSFVLGIGNFVNGQSLIESPSGEKTAAADRGALIDVPAKAQVTMPVSEVRVGMKGYGMTVFHGTKIEPFPVEVVSVIPDGSPKMATVWIKCIEPRLNQSGPVQGMSGSPIYLWEEDEEGTIGEGGRLIGAFAFGFSEVKYCLAGVQPIAYMRNVGSRIDVEELEEAKEGSEAKVAGLGYENGLRSLRTLARFADKQGVSDDKRHVLDQVMKLMGETEETKEQVTTAQEKVVGTQAMMLPMGVGSEAAATFAKPMLERFNITPYATVVGGGDALLGGKPTPGIDENTKIQPGGVLSIPLVYGDMLMAATGTVTDVMPDGRVLGFGHAMFGQGYTNVPLATGYVHFVVPRQSISFKQSSSLKMAGTIGQDESAAVAGLAGDYYSTAPVKVKVKLPNQPERSYQYRVVDHPTLTPILTLVSSLQSITAVQDVPPLCTMRAKMKIQFSGGRELESKVFSPNAGATDIVFGALPAMMAMTNNPFEQLKIKGFEVEVEVTKGVESATLVSARIDQADVAPGDQVDVTFTVQKYGGELKELHGSITVPKDTPEGNYNLMIANAQQYSSMKLATQPHLTKITNVDDLYEVLKIVLGVKHDSMYLVMNLADKGIAIGRSALPGLPSSRRAMIMNKTNTYATPYVEFAESEINTGLAVQGALNFQVKVVKKAEGIASATE